MTTYLRTIWAIATLLLTAACLGGGGGSGAVTPAAENGDGANPETPSPEQIAARLPIERSILPHVEGEPEGQTEEEPAPGAGGGAGAPQAEAPESEPDEPDETVPDWWMTAEQWAALTQKQKEEERARYAALQARKAILDSQNVRANRAVPVEDSANPHRLFARWERRLEWDHKGGDRVWDRGIEHSLDLDRYAASWEIVEGSEDPYLLKHARKGMETYFAEGGVFARAGYAHVPYIEDGCEGACEGETPWIAIVEGNNVPYAWNRQSSNNDIFKYPAIQYEVSGADRDRLLGILRSATWKGNVRAIQVPEGMDGIDERQRDGSITPLAPVQGADGIGARDLRDLQGKVRVNFNVKEGSAVEVYWPPVSTWAELQILFHDFRTADGRRVIENLPQARIVQGDTRALIGCGGSFDGFGGIGPHPCGTTEDGEDLYPGNNGVVYGAFYGPEFNEYAGYLLYLGTYEDGHPEKQHYPDGYRLTGGFVAAR